MPTIYRPPLIFIAIFAAGIWTEVNIPITVLCAYCAGMADCLGCALEDRED